MPPDYDGEVAFISGVNSDGTLALDSYAAWNDGTVPADYSGGYTLAYKWGGTTADTAGGNISYYFDPGSNWSATEQSMFAAGLALWAAVANISFTQTTSASSAQIVFKRGTNGAAETSPQFTGGSQAGMTGGTVLEHLTKATVSIDTSVSGFGPITTNFSTSGGYPIMTLLHEEGHAIGLGHAGPYNDTVNAATQQFGPYDSRLWSIMSYIQPTTSSAQYYSQYPVTGTSWGTAGGYPREPTTWMPLDILAIQQLYGLPTSTPLSGGQIFGFNTNITGAIAPFFDFNQNTLPIVTLWDMGSNNTLDISGFSQGATVNLTPGSFSSVAGLINNIGIAFGTMIDTVIGGPGNDTMTGNADVDYLYGGSGNDTLNGAGNDVLDGGFGNDTLNGAISGGDTASYADANAAVTVNLGLTGAQNTGAGGTDTLNNISSLFGGKYSDVLTAGPAGSSIHAGDGDDTLNGGPGNDMLYGDAGNDTLTGGGGDDLLDGGAGTNTVSYAGATSGVTVNLNNPGPQAIGGGQGTDTLANLSHVIGSNYSDVLTIGAPGKTSSATGGAGDDVINDSGVASFDDGGDGTDVLNLDWSTNTGPGINFIAGGVSNTYGQGQIQNIEILNLKTAVGANEGFVEPYRVQGMADSWVASATDPDTATVDLSADSNPVSLGGSGNAYAVADTTGTLVSFTNVDNFRITGGSGNDALTGGPGNDFLYGGAGKNVIQGGAGNDIITDAGSGGSILDGGSGINAVELDRSAATAPMTISFVPGSPLSLQDGTTIQNFQFLEIFTGSGDDNVFYDNPEQIAAPSTPGAFTDAVYAGGGNDTFGATFDRSAFAIDTALGSNIYFLYSPGLFNMNLYAVENVDLSGSAFNDALVGGAGNDILSGGPGNDSLDGGGGTDTVSYGSDTAGVIVNLALGIATGSASGNDTLANFENIVGGSGNDTLIGDGGANVLSGGSGDDVLRGGGGVNTLDGGSGTDTAAYALAPGDYLIAANNGGGYTVEGPGPVAGSTAFSQDTLANIENASFDATSQTLSMAQFAAQGFNPLDYIASNSDLLVAYGDNQTLGLLHFLEHGFFEGRSSTSFNPEGYLASNLDLLAAWGDNPTFALEHYILHGYYEGRTATGFNAQEYLASNTDILAGLGDDPTAATLQYVQHGYSQGRPTNSFNALVYIASNPDLLVAYGDNQALGLNHFLLHGYYEGRGQGSFNALQYIASNPDLLVSYGLDQTQALEHYILHGYYEGRGQGSFNVLEYVASNIDLATAWGSTNASFGYAHYILHGYYEGRPTASFDGVAYLLANTDLQTGGWNAQLVVTHYLDHGIKEGRTTGAFGSEQTQHALTLGTSLGDTIGTTGDEDWFSINLTAGQTYNLTLSGADSASGTLADPMLELHNANGVLVASDNDSGPGKDSLIHLTAPTTGLYYLVAQSNAPGATGTYKILAASA